MSSNSNTYSRKEKEKEQRKKDILLAAQTVMQEKGIDGMNMSAIAKEAQLAKGTLYLYFTSKEEILFQLNHQAMRKLLSTFQAFAAEYEAPLDQIANIMRSNLYFARNYPLASQLISIIEGNSNYEQHPELQRASRNISDMVVKVLEKGMADGSIRSSVEPRKFSFVMWGMTVGMLQMVSTRQSQIAREAQIDGEELFEHYIESTIHGLKA